MNAFASVGATGANGDAIRAYFMAIDPAAYEFGEGTGGTDLIVYLKDHTIRLLCGNFGTEMIPEESDMDQLSSDCFGVYDTVNDLWVQREHYNDDDVGVWVSPCLGPLPIKD